MHRWTITHVHLKGKNMERMFGLKMIENNTFGLQNCVSKTEYSESKHLVNTGFTMYPTFVFSCLAEQDQYSSGLQDLADHIYIVSIYSPALCPPQVSLCSDDQESVVHQCSLDYSTYIIFTAPHCVQPKYHCVLMTWGTWSSCNCDWAGCTQTRTRDIAFKPACGGDYCEDTTEAMPCVPSKGKY